MSLMDIFTEGDIRYADDEYEIILSGFVNNKAIIIEELPVSDYKGPNTELTIKGPQKNLKSIAITLLEKGGFSIIDMEKSFGGGIADILAEGDGGIRIAVECGPCSMRKGIDYLENPDTSLWIVRHNILYIIKRGPCWNDYHDAYASYKRNILKKPIEKLNDKRESCEPESFIRKCRTPRILNPGEVAEMLRIAYGNPRDSLLMKSLYFLGLTNTEAQNLEVNDIDLNHGFVVIKRENKRERNLPIPSGLAPEIKDYIGVRRGGPLIMGRGKGQKLSDRHIRRIVKDYAKAAGIKNYEEIHPHTLRHSYASHLQNSGVPLNIIQDLLGHERLETTTIFYGHTSINRAKDFIDNAFK